MSASPRSQFPRLGRSTVVVGVIAMVVVITAGILLLGGSRNGDPGAAIAGVRIYQCPQGANLLGEIAAGTQVGIIARSDDGEWLQFYHRAGEFDRVWAERAALAPAMDVSPLPAADCGVAGEPGTPAGTILIAAGGSPTASSALDGDPTSEASGSPVPGPSTAPPTGILVIVPTPSATTGATAGPTAASTPALTAAPTFVLSAPPTLAPTPSPTATTIIIGPPAMTIKPPSPTPLLDLTGPALSLLGQSTKEMFIPEACDPNEVRITVSAEDPSGVNSVTLWWKAPGGTLYVSKTMSIYKGSATKAIWETTVTTNSKWSAGEMSFFVTAIDSKGNDSRLPVKGDPPRTVTVYSFCLVLKTLPPL